jgi:hypothetical protein
MEQSQSDVSKTFSHGATAVKVNGKIMDYNNVSYGNKETIENVLATTTFNNFI